MGLKFKKLLYGLLIAICFTFITPVYAYAQWGQVTCPGIDKCYGCSAFNCSVYKVQNLTVRFSYDECKKIVQRGNSISDFTGYASIIVGLKNGIASTWLSLYSMNVSKNIEMFKTAVAKNSGLELKAEYVINKNSYSLNRYRKASKKYIPNETSKKYIPNKTSSNSGYYRLLKVTSPLMYGSDIKKVQSKLNSLGYNAGKVDGYYGNNTKNAIIRFQKAKKISADGIVGPQTWNKLF